MKMQLDEHRGRRRLVGLGLLAAFVLIVSAGLGAGDLPDEDLDQALAPLEALAVQEDGFVRGAGTYAQGRLVAIHGKRKFEGRSALAMVLWLMSDRHAAHATPILKVGHPELGKLFGDKRISLDQYQDPVLRQRMIELYRSDTGQLEKPVGALEGKANLLAGLEKDFAIIPREEEWVSPLELRSGGGAHAGHAH